MRMSMNSYNKLNQLVGKCFNANAVVDNLSYSLDYHYFNEIAKIVHLRVAHELPVLADLISDKMLELSARPIRVAIGSYNTDYETPKEVFDVLLETLTDLLETTRSLINEADLNEDDEVRIFCEEFLTKISIYVKQAEEWVNAANVMDAHTLNVHIKEYTHFITL